LKKAIAVSNTVKYEIVSFYGVPSELIVVIPNGVDFQGFQSSDHTSVRENARKTAEKFDWSKVADEYIEVCKSL